MAYNIKDVFYLSTSALIAATTNNGGSAQLDLSAYIDPIARGRSKGTGLAIYKVHVSVNQSGSGDPIAVAEAGTFSYGLLAGAGLGDLPTGQATIAGETFEATNALLVESGSFYGPSAMTGVTTTPASMYNTAMHTSTEVPYVIVRDNVCLVYQTGANMTADTILSVRLECAQITLDQATLNQLLRTQTV